MDPFTGAAITGGASLLGSIFSGFNSDAQQQQAEQFDQSMVNQQENYETQMSNTAYQRAQADMKAAGLNPIAMAGGGASTPSISAPTIAPNVQSSQAIQKGADAVGQAVATAQQIKATNAQIDQTSAQTDQTQANTDLVKNNAANAELQSDKIRADTAASMAQERNINADTANKEAQNKVLLNNAAIATGANKWNSSTIGQWGNAAGAAGDTLSQVISPIGTIVSSASGAARAGLIGNRFGPY